LAHSAKAYYAYDDDQGHTYSFLQDQDVATAIGNAAAAVGTPRLPHKLKPRKVGLRVLNGGTSPGGAVTYSYSHAVVGAQLFAGLTVGSDITDGVATWKVIAFRDEKNAALSAY
jgi:hypothetical protein